MRILVPYISGKIGTHVRLENRVQVTNFPKYGDSLMSVWLTISQSYVDSLYERQYNNVDSLS